MDLKNYTTLGRTGRRPARVAQVTHKALLISVLLITIHVAAGVPQEASAKRPGDNGLAVNAEINGPLQIAVDGKGNIYIYQSAREYSGIHLLRIERGAIRKIDSSSHKITTLAGGCEPRLHAPPTRGLCFGLVTHLSARSGRLILSDFDNNKIWALNLRSLGLLPDAGNGKAEFGGDGGPATQASIIAPHGFAVDDSGNIFICDSSHRIRRVDARTGIISTVAGNGKPGFSGDRGSALHAQITNPTSVAVDRSGNLYIADDTSQRIRRVDASTGIIETIAGNGQPGFMGAGGPALSASIGVVHNIAVDPVGNLLFVAVARICRVDFSTGILSIVAGTGEVGFSGDGGLATQARIEADDLALDRDGNVFFADYANNRIRRIDAKTGIITTIGGNGLQHRAASPVY